MREFEQPVEIAGSFPEISVSSDDVTKSDVAQQMFAGVDVLDVADCEAGPLNVRGHAIVARAADAGWPPGRQ